MATAMFAAGCFWGVEAEFRRVEGVKRTEVGYTGGDLADPTYEAVCAGRTGHAEAVRVEFDEAGVAYERLLEVSEEDPDVMNDLAILRDGMGDRAGAVALWERVLNEEPDNLNALENLFTHTWERGEGAAAREYLRRGLEAARRRNGPVDRWLWFQDRLLWTPVGFGERA